MQGSSGGSVLPVCAEVGRDGGNRPQGGISERNKVGKPCGAVYLCVAEKRGKAVCLREGEVEGSDYFFVSKERFEEAIKNNELLEHATFVNNSYGTPKSYVEKLRNEGKNVLLEIETNGARSVMEKSINDPLFVSIFLLPPSFEELEKRIRGRRTEEESIVQERLGKAKKEINLQNMYQYQVIDVTPEQAAVEISNIIKSKIKL